MNKNKLRPIMIVIGGIFLIVIGLALFGVSIPIILSAKGMILNEKWVQLIATIILLILTACYGLVSFFLGLALLVPDKFIEDL